MFVNVNGTQYFLDFNDVNFYTTPRKGSVRSNNLIVCLIIAGLLSAIFIPLGIVAFLFLYYVPRTEVYRFKVSIQSVGLVEMELSQENYDIFVAGVNPELRIDT